MQVYDTLHEYLASVQKVFNPKLGRLDYISSGQSVWVTLKTAKYSCHLLEISRSFVCLAATYYDAIHGKWLWQKISAQFLG